MDRRKFLLGSGVALSGLASCSDDAPGANPPGPAPSAPANPPVLPIPNLGPQPPDGRQVTYAQQGEDLILMQALSMLGISKPRYLDVGAFHPTIGSNTYLAYLSGGQGVLVEPNPPMAQMLREVRPRDEIVNAGVGVGEAGSAPYYLIADRPQLNTFSKSQLDRYLDQGRKLENTLDMTLVSIDALLQEHFAQGVDLLSIDVEGLDLEIIESMRARGVRPAVICVETAIFGSNALVRPIVEVLRARGYAVRGGSMINTIFVDEAALQANAPEGSALSL